MQNTESHAELASFLQQYKNTKFVYISNPGNAGDSFIAHSTFQFFDRLGLNYELGSANNIYPGRTVIYAGGGNLVAPYPNAIQFIQRNHNVCKTLVVLPHTISSYGDTLAKLGSNCFIFCREKPSYDYVRQHARRAQVFLSHDMALSVDIGKIRGDAKVQRGSINYIYKNYQRNFKLTLICWRHFFKTGIKNRTLHVFRNDVEKTDQAIPNGNFDASDVFATRDFSQESCLDTTYKLISFLDRYDTIQTNRLHICILSLLLGKHVLFHSNSYFKNRAIFEHSLKDRFPTLKWCGD